MYSEQLALMLFIAAAQMAPHHIKPLNGPAFEDPRHALIRAVKEPELVAALSLKAKRAGMRKQPTLSGDTFLASVY